MFKRNHTATPSLNERPCIQQVQYWINIDSFNQFYPGTDVTRIIEDAARQWNWAGGSRRVLDNMGTTSESGCGLFGTNSDNISAAPGCPGGNCTVCATTALCWGGTFNNWEITVYPDACSGGIWPTIAPGFTDLETIVLHEFGHAQLGTGHIDPSATH